MPRGLERVCRDESALVVVGWVIDYEATAAVINSEDEDVVASERRRLTAMMHLRLGCERRERKSVGKRSMNVNSHKN